MSDSVSFVHLLRSFRLHLTKKNIPGVLLGVTSSLRLNEA